MKNTEWGSVAYLQHSVYGSRTSVRINNNSSYITGYSGVNEPTCGYTADNRDCNRYEGTALNQDGEYTKRYNTEIGYLASTTGNITGIYDVNGGSQEFVMGVMTNSNGQPCAGRNSSLTSGFAGPYCYTSGSATGISFPEEKYYDTYLYGTDNTHYNRRILGDATGEVGPFVSVALVSEIRPIGSWYGNDGWFVRTLEPWFTRSGAYYMGSAGGMFALAAVRGSVDNYGSYRIVLAM